MRERDVNNQKVFFKMRPIMSLSLEKDLEVFWSHESSSSPTFIFPPISPIVKIYFRFTIHSHGSNIKGWGSDGGQQCYEIGLFFEKYLVTILL